MAKESFESRDFTGGLSDEYIPATEGKLEAAENVCLDFDLNLVQRPGSNLLYNASEPGPINANIGEVSVMKETKTDLILGTKHANAFFPKNPAIPQNFATPSSNPVFLCDVTGVEHSTHRANSFLWKEQMFSTNTELALPLKVWKDDLKGYTAVNAGLPYVSLNQVDFYNGKLAPVSTSTYTLGIDPLTGGTITVEITQNNGTTVSTANAAPTFLPGYYFSTGDRFNPGTKVTYDHWYAFQVSFRRNYTVNQVEFSDNGGGDIFYISCAAGKVFGAGATDLKIVVKITKPETNAFRHYSGSAFSSPIPLRLCMYRTIQNGATFYEVDPAYNTTSWDNYYTTSGINDIQWRAETAGSTSSGGLQIYATNDEGLLQKPLAYFNGGVLQNDEPPFCRYVSMNKDVAYFGNIAFYESRLSNEAAAITYIPERVLLSAPADPDSVPEGNFVDFPEEVTGIGIAGNYTIVGTKAGIYRLDGNYDDLGSGLVSYQKISGETGCISHSSMVTVQDKLYFAGIDGFYVTDGVNVGKMTLQLDKTFSYLVNDVNTDSYGVARLVDFEWCRRWITGHYDRINDRILWTFKDQAYCLELKASNPERASYPFYGPWYVGTSKTASLAQGAFITFGSYNDQVVRGDRNGYVYQMSAGYMSDPRTDNAVSYTLWGRVPILYRARMAKNIFGSMSIKKWVSSISALFKRRRIIEGTYAGQEANIDIQINAYNDGERVRQELKPIHYTGTIDNTYDESPKVGTSVVSFDSVDTIYTVTRRFGAKGLRCVTKAVEFTNGRHLVSKSSDFANGDAVVFGTAVSMQSGDEFPVEAIDLDQKNYVIAFDVDDYATKYVVSSVSDPAITLVLSSAPANGTYKWKLYSYSNYQFFGLVSYSMAYVPLVSKFGTYHLDQQGGNAGDKGE